MNLRPALERALLRRWYPSSRVGPPSATGKALPGGVAIPGSGALPGGLARSGIADHPPDSASTREVPRESLASASDESCATHRVEYLCASALAWILASSPLSYPLAAATSLAGKLRAQAIVRAPGQQPPVVVVGNWVVGGGGKTPVVIALARALLQRGYRVAILSNGYGGVREGLLWPEVARSEAGYAAYEAGWSDEAVLIALLTGAPVSVGKDRTRALARLLEALPALDLILSDDGLQHSRLVRRGEIVVVDQRGLGNAQCLPRGPLRAPMGSREPSDWVVLRHAWATPGGGESSNEACRADDERWYRQAQRVLSWPLPVPQVLAWSAWKAVAPPGREGESVVREQGGAAHKGESAAHEREGAAQGPAWAQALPSRDLDAMREAWRGRNILGIAGIANPQALIRQCSHAGIAARWLLPGDHKAMQLRKVQAGDRKMMQAGWVLAGCKAEVILLTAKDAVKYHELDDRCHVLVQVDAAPAPLCAWLEDLIRPPAQASAYGPTPA